MRIDKNFHRATVNSAVPAMVVLGFKLARAYAKLFPGIEGLHTPGQQAELIAEHCYGMKRAPRGRKGYDFTDRLGNRVQVKGFSSASRGPSFRIYRDKRGKPEKLTDQFDRLLVMHITKEGWRVTCNRAATSLVDHLVSHGADAWRLPNGLFKTL
jgi:hypothetical protein